MAKAAASKKSVKKPAKKAAEKPPEDILVIPRKVFNDVCGPISGLRLTTRGEDELRELIATAKPFYTPRPAAEVDTSLKQLIPYVVFRAGTDKGPAIFSYQRSGKAGESRLHQKYSIGIGGHINPCDGNHADSYVAFQQAMHREINEEVDLGAGILTTTYFGLLNDDSNQVGEVHLGVVYLIQLTQPRLKLREKVYGRGAFRTYAQLTKINDKLENWSAMVFEQLLKAK